MRCHGCGCIVEKERVFRNMSNNPYCSTCFHRDYAHCINCGRVCYISHKTDQNEPVCYDCWREVFTWTPLAVPKATAFTRVGSQRCFGLELETSACPGYSRLRGRTCFGVKPDYSVAGMEFYSPILQGNSGLNFVCEFCQLAKEHNFKVDYRCGFHIHLDMRRTTKRQRKATAYAYRLTYFAWASMVNARRRASNWCHAPYYELEDIRDNDIDDFLEDSNQQDFVNLYAYKIHETFEIRGYQGTLNPRKICNWICALAIC